MRRDRHARRGQALVESAFVLLVFLAFCIGTLDFGQYLYFHQALSERVRAAARYGALNWTDRTGIQNVALYNDPAGTVNGATAIIPNLTAAMVAVCLPGDTGCSNPASTTESRITSRSRATTWLPSTSFSRVRLRTGRSWRTYRPRSPFRNSPDAAPRVICRKISLTITQMLNNR